MVGANDPWPAAPSPLASHSSGARGAAKPAHDESDEDDEGDDSEIDGDDDARSERDAGAIAASAGVGSTVVVIVVVVVVVAAVVAGGGRSTWPRCGVDESLSKCINRGSIVAMAGFVFESERALAFSGAATAFMKEANE
jgi:hypothetical protein